jgi:4-amino-4-deoxy-L-arabinose transferase-like glycosyltransferase
METRPPAPEQPTVHDAPQPAPQPFDPRHPQHPDHALEQNVRRQLQDLNAAHDIKVTPEQLDNCTAAMLADARGAKLSGVKSMEFYVFPDGSTNCSRLIMYEGPPHDLAYWTATTNMAQAVNTPAEQSYQRFEQNTQVMAQQEQQMREQRQQREQQSQGGPVMRIER